MTSQKSTVTLFRTSRLGDTSIRSGAAQFGQNLARSGFSSPHCGQIGTGRVYDWPPPEPDYYLLYPEKRTPDRRVYWADPEKQCASNTVHRWWYRMLEQAGLVGHGVRPGLNMHRRRHYVRDGVCTASPASRPPHRRSGIATYRRRSWFTVTKISVTSSVPWKPFAKARAGAEDEAANRGNDSPSRLD